LLPHFGGLLLPPCRCAPSLQLGVLVTTVPLRRHPHDTGVDDLPATRHVALGRKMLVEAVEQLLDQPGLGQLLAEQPKPRGVRTAALDREPQKARERQPVAHLIFHLLVRQIVERLQNQHPEHQDGIERLPAGAALLELVRCEHHRLDRGTKALPRHEMIDGFERIAARRQGFQALIGIEKSQLPHRRLCESKSHASDSTGREKQLFFEVPLYNSARGGSLIPVPADRTDDLVRIAYRRPRWPPPPFGACHSCKSLVWQSSS